MRIQRLWFGKFDNFGSFRGESCQIAVHSCHTFLSFSEGILVKSQDVPNGSQVVNIPTYDLSDGIYFVTLVIDGKVCQQEKLIVLQ